MIKKKLLCPFLILTFASCLVACGDNEENETNENTTIAAETTTEEVTTSENVTTTEKETTSATVETTTQNETTSATVEATTQKETTSATVETTTQKETTSATEETTTKPEAEYQLSSKGYDTLTKWSDNLYITKVNDKFGVIDTNGETVIDFIYDSFKYANADSSEVLFAIENSCVVYNNNLKKIVEYTGSSDNYTNGMLIVRKFLDDDFVFPSTELTIKNVYTNTVLYSDTYKNGPFEIQNFEIISKNNFDASIMVWREDVENYGYGTVTIVTPSGNTKIDKTMPYSSSCHYTNGAYYLFANVLNYEYESLINLNNKEEFDITSIFKDSTRYYYGNGITYAVTKDNTNYTIYKGSTVLTSKEYTWMNFNKNCIVAGDDTTSHILDYNGNILKTFNDIDVNEYNGKRLVYDGVGVYYIDSNYNKVSDYIVKGTGITVSGGTIKIDGKRYFIKK